MTIDEANELFSMFIDDSAINWKIINTHCHARADKMAETALSNGRELNKVWALPIGDNQICISFNKTGTEVLTWNYHVAIVGQVMTEGEKSQAMVFDPSLFDKAVSLIEWEDRLKLNNKDIKFKVSDIYRYENYDDVLTEGLLKLYKNKRDSVLEESFNDNHIETLIGKELNLRGAFLDSLEESNPTELIHFKNCLKIIGFKEWWTKYYTVKELNNILAQNFHFYGPKDKVIQELLQTSTNVEANYLIKTETWKDVASSLESLKKKYSKLRNDKSELGLDFFNNSNNDEFIDLWFSAEGFELWHKYLGKSNI
jgi:hypothetical protein